MTSASAMKLELYEEYRRGPRGLWTAALLGLGVVALVCFLGLHMQPFAGQPFRHDAFITVHGTKVRVCFPTLRRVGERRGAGGRGRARPDKLARAEWRTHGEVGCPAAMRSWSHITTHTPHLSP